MNDEIGKLIEEQKKTQEAIKKLEETGTLQKFLEKIEPAVVEYGNNEFVLIDPWDYDALEAHRKDMVAKLIYQIYDAAGKMKYYMHYVDCLYELRMEELAETKGYEKMGKQERKKLLRERYKNPLCRKFFKKYEADHLNNVKKKGEK